MPTVGPVTRSAPILLVEDDADLRTSLAEVLADEGYEVWCANNGEEALATLRERSAPGAILLDLTMPVMDGWTFRARQRDDPRIAGIPTVVISASYSDLRAVDALGADAFLAKPFDVTSLISALERVS
jgi:CheY-like chemotaxis protein